MVYITPQPEFWILNFFLSPMPTSIEDSPVLSPQKYLGLATLLRLNLAGADLSSTLQSLIKQATDDPNDAGSLLDAAVVFQFHGNPQLALNLQAEALQLCRHYSLPAQQPAELRLLALMAPGDLTANVPVDCLLENANVDLDIYYATGADFDPAEIPDHDVLFVAISESAANRTILDAWLPLLMQWPRPVLINTLHIERVARDAAASLL